jgi:triosephosphate isomerase (TIM)
LKMNGLIGEATRIVEPLRRGTDGLACDIVVCPPATILNAIAHILVGSSVAVGGQDCHAMPRGAHTGDVSAMMLRDAGASWVILGHSERRARHGETDALVRAKIGAATAAGLRPIVCVGESEADRNAGRAEAVVRSQLAGSLPPGFAGTVAYEPIWAIGSGKSASDADAAAMHAVIRDVVGPLVRILYGGSVRPENATGKLSQPNVDGALVGGASLDASAFLEICVEAGMLP